MSFKCNFSSAETKGQAELCIVETCGHMFHIKCLQKHLDKNIRSRKNCPWCQIPCGDHVYQLDVDDPEFMVLEKNICAIATTENHKELQELISQNESLKLQTEQLQKALLNALAEKEGAEASKAEQESEAKKAMTKILELQKEVETLEKKMGEVCHIADEFMLLKKKCSKIIARLRHVKM